MSYKSHNVTLPSDCLDSLSNSDHNKHAAPVQDANEYGGFKPESNSTVTACPSSSR